jgi:hypothetical protein
LTPVADTGAPLHADLPAQERLHLFSDEIQKQLPEKGFELSNEQESHIKQAIQSYWRINAKVELEGNRLNHAYGKMGAEQHLPRFPGDTATQHDAYVSAGITPARGAWGYFANSKATLTPDLVEKEKYYVAVQTLYLPEWNTNWKELKEWYKHRKVIVVNPENGKVIVCVIGDAGPAKYTGKHFGGSPETMHYLDIVDKDRVVLLFVDDPENAISLGPVEYN